MHFSVFLYQYITLLASLIISGGGSRDPKDPPGSAPECSYRALNFALVHICTCRGTRAVQATHANKMNMSCMHACSSIYTRQQNECLVHARVQFKLHTPTK